MIGASARCAPYAMVLAASAAVLDAAQPTFKGRVDAVRIDVSVMHGGQPVHGLTASDFVVLDNGAAQRIEQVSGERSPVSVVMALDVSGSVAGDKLRHLVAAGHALVGALVEGDRAALVTFSHDVRVRVPLTANRAQLAAALDELKADGPTALRDAIWSALQLRPMDESRPLVLVFTDGLDTASWLSSSEILGAARRLGVVIHVVELATEQAVTNMRGLSTRQVFGNPFLETIANSAGGRLWSATDSKHLPALFTQALEEMRARYLLTFYPEPPARSGWHDLKVSLKTGRAEITARRGYQVP